MNRIVKSLGSLLASGVLLSSGLDSYAHKEQSNRDKCHDDNSSHNHQHDSYLHGCTNSPGTGEGPALDYSEITNHSSFVNSDSNIVIYTGLSVDNIAWLENSRLVDNQSQSWTNFNRPYTTNFNGTISFSIPKEYFDDSIGFFRTRSYQIVPSSGSAISNSCDRHSHTNGNGHYEHGNGHGHGHDCDDSDD
jgi:hypothetical protein